MQELKILKANTKDIQKQLKNKPRMMMTQEVYDEIKNTIGLIPAESGGILLGDRKNFVITKIVFDADANTTRSTYEFNHVYLNKVLRANPDLQILGYIHSHPPSSRQLSQPDRKYFNAQFAHLDTSLFYTPIVISKADTGKFELISYLTFKDDAFNPIEGELKIMGRKKSKKKASVKQLTDFSRINDAVDMAIIDKTKLVVVGTGGSFSLIENFVRTGVIDITLIDFDEVEESNIVRQGYFMEDVGKLKISALENHLKKINPAVKVRKFNQRLEALSPLQMDFIFDGVGLALFLTDSFVAQAMGNKIAIQYNIPSLFAGFYEGSKCCELFFSIPNVTKACFRCAVSSRYKAQAEATEEIKASSQSNTIFHSQFLDSIIGMIAMAILHNDTEGFYFSNWFGKEFEYNFFQVRTHPDYGTEKGSLFQRTIGNFPESAAFIFNSIAQPVEIEQPPKYDYSCPDCQEQ